MQVAENSKTSCRWAALGKVALVSLWASACVSAPPVGHVSGSGPSPSPFPRAYQPGADSSPATPGARGPHAPPPVSGGTGAYAPGAMIVDSALALQGVDYQYGGEDPATGLDCSGLIQYVFRQYGVIMPRTVEDQYRIGERINQRELQAGDLIFFSTIGPGATHVGIALGPSGPGQFVHAPATGGVVRVERYDSSYWASRIVGMRRVVQAPAPLFSASSDRE